MPAEKVRVAILDDHQSIIDGYIYRLSGTPEIEVTATATYGEELESVLSMHPADVLLLDLSVRTSPENPNPFPILFLVPKLLQKYPKLNVLIISMFAEPGLMRSIIEAGASGYILKDDQSAFRELGNVVLSIAHGGIFFSKKAHSLYMQADAVNGSDLLTPRADDDCFQFDRAESTLQPLSSTRRPLAHSCSGEGSRNGTHHAQAPSVHNLMNAPR
jgi:DNA-binding NarL/FixJ family response regulator